MGGHGVAQKLPSLRPTRRNPLRNDALSGGLRVEPAMTRFVFTKSGRSLTSNNDEPDITPICNIDVEIKVLL
jgi:hypothetical protein